VDPGGGRRQTAGEVRVGRRATSTQLGFAFSAAAVRARRGYDRACTDVPLRIHLLDATSHLVGLGICVWITR
jgi:hypothetical protein